MNKKILSKIFSGIVCLTLVIPVISGIGAPQIAEAAGPVHHAKGWAFSDMPDQSEAAVGVGCTRENIVHFNCAQGLGWISMASSNTNSGGGSYEVTLDPVTGKFGGYAWSEMGGWVDFAPSATPPQNSHTVARSAFVDPACLADKTKTCDIKGWIRFVNGGIGQWDGWVSMDARNPTLVTGGTDDTAYSVKLLPEINGIRKFSGFAYGDWVVGWVDFGKAQLELTDVCPDTKFVVPTDPKKTGIDPKTAGVQTTMPAGYSVKDGLCGIFGCTDKLATNYEPKATINDGSCTYIIECPDGTPAPNNDPDQCPQPPTCTPKSDDYNPFFKDCRTCHPGTANYDDQTGLCEPVIPTCPDGSAIPPGGCPGETNVCTTTSPTYNPVFKDCRECHPGIANYNATTGQCTVTVQCETTSPDYNPITEDCRTCHPGVAGYNDQTGRCSVPGKRKAPIIKEV